MKTRWIDHFYELCILISECSKDPNKKVGAVIVDTERRLVGTGYNGFPRGVNDDPERYAEQSVKLAMIVHSEVNAILNANKSVRGCTLITMRPPCSRCSCVIIQSGIDTVICPELSPTSDWIDDWQISKQMLSEAFVHVEHRALPRHGKTQEAYYVDGLRSVLKDLERECRPGCNSVMNIHTDDCPDANFRIESAQETISRLLRGKND